MADAQFDLGVGLPRPAPVIDADGVRVGGPHGTLVRWEEMTGVRIAPWTRWVGESRSSGSGRGSSVHWTRKTDLLFQLMNAAGVPILFADVYSDDGPAFHALVTETNDRTPQIPYVWTLADEAANALERVGPYARVPRQDANGTCAPATRSVPVDGEMRLRPSAAKGRTRIRTIVWVAITAALAVYVRPWTSSEAFDWLLVLWPSVFLAPLWFFAALEEFGAPLYTLRSSGGGFSLTRSTLFWKKQWEGRWSAVTATRVEIGTSRPSPLFVIERNDGEPIEMKNPAGEVLAWITERTPLPYAWADMKATTLPILEAQGSFARVARDVASV